MTKKTKRLIIVASVAISVVGVLIAFYSLNTKYKQELELTQQNCQAQLSSLQNELNSKKLQVYVPVNDVKPGQVLSPDMLEEVTIFTDSDPNAFLDIKSLTAENEDAVESLKAYLSGDRGQLDSDEDYDDYVDYAETVPQNTEDAGTEAIEPETEAIAPETEVSSEAREEIITESAVTEGTDLPTDAVTEGKTDIAVEDEIATETDELLDTTSIVSEEIIELTGVVAVTELPAGQPIYKSAVQIMDCSDLREKYINFVTLNTNLEEGDTVDIRIKFPNGEDYVVLSKDVLRDLNLAGAEFYLWVNEESILRLSAATVDAAINGGEIYVTKYVKPSVQDPLVYTYQPPEDVLRLIQWDPNIILDAENTYSNTKRGEFEARLKAFNSRGSEEDAANSDLSATTTN